MNIVLRNSDNLVMWCGNDLSIDASGVHGTGWIYPQLNSTTATLVQNVTLPNPYVANVYSYSAGVFTIANQTALTTWNTATLPSTQTSQIATTIAAYLVANTTIVSYTSKGGVTKTFQADKDAVNNIQGCLAGFSSTSITPTGFYWVASDNTQVIFTFADLQLLAEVMILQSWTNFQKLQTLKSTITSATTVTAVQAVVW